MERKGDANRVNAYSARLVVDGPAPVGRPKKTYQNTLSTDMHLSKLTFGTSMKWSAPQN